MNTEVCKKICNPTQGLCLSSCLHGLSSDSQIVNENCGDNLLSTSLLNKHVIIFAEQVKCFLHILSRCPKGMLEHF